MKKKIFTFTVVLAFLSALTLTSQWKFCNGPYGGYNRDMVYDKTTQDIFANSYYIYKFNNSIPPDPSSKIWEKQIYNLDTIYYYYLNIAGDVYFLNYMDRSDCIMNTGVYRSTDRGINWERIKDYHDVFRDVLYLDSNNILACGSFFSGIVKSTDKGITWSECNNGIDSAVKSDGGAFDNFNTITTDTAVYIFSGAYNKGIYRSSNNGELWEKKTAGLPDTSITIMTTTRDNIVYAALMQFGIYRSTDLGESWEKFDKGLDSMTIIEFYDMTSDKEGNVYACSYYYGMLRLNVKTGIWEFINKGFIPNSIYDILYIEDKDELYLSTYSAGVYKSTDHGESWFDYSNGIDLPTSIKCIAAAKDGCLFAGSEYNGVYYSSDKGTSWKLINNGIEKDNINTIKINHKGEVFAYSNEERIYKTTDNGEKWERIYLGIGNSNPYISNALAFNTKDEIFATLEEKGIIYSGDGGENWSNIGFKDKRIYSLTIDNRDNIYISYDSSIFRSQDNGVTWTEVYIHNDRLSVLSYLVTKDNTIFAGTYKNSIIRSTDDGRTWIQLINDLPLDADFTCFAYSEKSNRIFCGTRYNGYFVSSDKGETWNNYELEATSKKRKEIPLLQLAPEVFRDFVIDENNTLFAATYNGVYKLDIQSSVKENIIQKHYLTITPNPANQLITIDYELSESGFTYINLVNQFGQEIPLLKEGFEEAGCHSLSFDISNIPSSIYFCKIKSGTNIKIRKFIIVR